MDSSSLSAAASAYVRSFNRYEYKYVLRQDQALALLADAAAFTRPDPNDPEGAGYPVHSLYWDTPDLAFFWEKLDGIKVRRKLRFRHYAGGDEVFVEIKQRIDRTIQKRRARMPRAAAERLFAPGALAALASGEREAHAETDDPVLHEALSLCARQRLAPTIAVAYRRRARFGLWEPDLRITFDTHLVYDTTGLAIGAEVTGDARAILDPRLCVLEIKFDDRVPIWLVRLVEHHGLEIRRFSKYCAAVDQAHFGGRYS